jgi:hypothetical protein
MPTALRGHVFSLATCVAVSRNVGWAKARFGPKAHHLRLGCRASEMVGQRTEAVLGPPYLLSVAGGGRIFRYDILPGIQGHAHAKRWAWHPAEAYWFFGARTGCDFAGGTFGAGGTVVSDLGDPNEA